jgi:hypothetical protein
LNVRRYENVEGADMLEVDVTLRLTVGRSVSQYVLVSGTPSGPMTRFYFSLSFALRPEAPSLTRGRVCNLSVVRVVEVS